LTFGSIFFGMLRILPTQKDAAKNLRRFKYWRACLQAGAEPQQPAPSVQAREHELEAQVADLERRLHRQLLNLEADDTTAALRRRVAARVDELETAITQQRQQLTALRDQAAQSAADAPTLADVAPLLDRLPLLTDRLPHAPHAELRALLESLQLDVACQPAEQALDVTITLYDADDAAENAEDWNVPPAGFEPAAHGLGMCFGLIRRGPSKCITAGQGHCRCSAGFAEIRDCAPRTGTQRAR
jgi:hypothetical protein